jgi:hypothetical protein
MYFPPPDESNDQRAAHSNAQDQSDSIDEEILAFALESLANGVKPKKLRQDLFAAGYTEKQVAAIVGTAQQHLPDYFAGPASAPSPHRQARVLMASGCGFCLLGLGGTIVCAGVAASLGTGGYVAFTGLMIVGAGLFLRGAIQAAKL